MSTIFSEEQTSTARSDLEEEVPVDLSLLRELGKNSLVKVLNSVNGAKTLVLDPSVAGPLGLLTEVSLLKQHGVDKMFWLEQGPLSATTTNIVYLVRPKVGLAKIIAEQVKLHIRDGQKHTYSIFLVPRESTLVKRILEEEGVLGEVTISSFNMQFIPLSDDIVSLENESAFKEIWADGDESIVYDAAQALVTFQKLYGVFPRIVGKGDVASRMTTLLHRNMDQLADPVRSESLISNSQKIDSLIILDRKVDMVTPMLTQLTYAGLIDESIGIKNSYVELPASLLTPPSAQTATSAASSSTAGPSSLPKDTKESKKKYHLSPTTDVLFNELQDLNFSCVGKTLNKTARRLDEDYKSRLQAKTVAQLRDFVGKLNGLQSEHQSLRIHTGLSEILVPITKSELFGKALEIQQNLLASYDPHAQVAAIEDMIAQDASPQLVLRLMCLASIVNGGIKIKILEHLKREFLQTYGYEYLPLLLTLSSPSLALLLPNPLPSSSASLAATKLPYNSLRKSLRLITDEIEELEDPADISYVYSGFAPMSIRLVQCVVQKGALLKASDSNGESSTSRKPGQTKMKAHPIVGWKGFEDVLDSLPGATIDVTPKGPNDSTSPAATALTSTLSNERRTTTSVVFFLGGCTYTEIAALRWINSRLKGRRILIATTSIVSGSSIINSLTGSVKSNTEGKDYSV